MHLLKLYIPFFQISTVNQTDNSRRSDVNGDEESSGTGELSLLFGFILSIYLILSCCNPHPQLFSLDILHYSNLLLGCL